MKFKWNHTGVAGEGFEVNGRVKNALFEGVEFWLMRPLSIISYSNSDSYYMWYSSTIIDYRNDIGAVSKGLIYRAVEGDFEKLKSHCTLT